MYRSRGQAIVCATVVALLTLVSSSAFATWGVEVWECNPEEDEYECECTPEEQEYAMCQSVTESNLLSPDDPNALRTAANMTTTWDDENEIYVVTAETSGFNAGGILPMISNEGDWSSMEELTGYLSELLDIPVNADGSLPPFKFIQYGSTEKWNQAADRWATENHTGLVLNAITGDDGNLTIDGQVIELVADAPTCTSGTDYPLGISQCSFSHLPAPININGTDFFWGHTWTDMGELSMYGKDSNARAVRHPDLDLSFTKAGYIADSLNIKNRYFEATSPLWKDDQTNTGDYFIKVGVYYFNVPISTGYQVDGVCGDGTASVDVSGSNNSVPLDTNNGNFDSSHPRCQ